MAWSRLQSAVSASAGAAVTTVGQAFTTANLTSGTTVIALVSISSVTVSGVTGVTMTCGGTSMVLIKTVTSGSAGAEDVLALYALNTPAGQAGTKPTVTASWTNNGNGSLLIQEVSGLATGATLATLADGTPGGNTGSGGTSAAQGAYSSTALNEYLVAIYGDDGGTGAYTIPSGYTGDANNVGGTNGAANVGLSYKNSTNGAESGTYTLTGAPGQWGTILVAFKLAASGSAAPVIPRRGPAGIRRTLPFRKGRSTGNTGTASGTGPAVVPPGGPAGQVHRAPGPFRKGRAQGSAGGPVLNPVPVIPPRGPARARIPAPFSKGRAQGSQGTSSQAGPALIPPQGPAGLGRRPGPFRKGRAQGSAGTPGQAGPRVTPPPGPMGSRLPGPFRKGRAQGSQGTYSGLGPPLTPPAGPAGLSRRAPGPFRKGRAQGTPGAPVQNVAPTSGPPITPPIGPSGLARRAPGPFRKGRAQGSAGTSAGLGPAIVPPRGPAGLRQRAPGPFRKGQAQGSSGTSAGTGAPVIPQRGPSRPRLPWPVLRGRGRGNPGAFAGTGPAITPPARPAGLGRKAPGPFLAGRTQGNTGGPSTVPTPGPPIIAQRSPAGLVRRAPGPWRKGRTQGNPGGPVIPPPPIGPINTWTASRQINGPGFGYGAPANGSLDCAVASTAGNWLIAICSWTLPPGYLGCTMEIADDVHGFWIPLGAPSGDSSAAGLTRCSIWARPGGSAQNPVPGAGHVYAAPAGLPGPVYPAVIGMTVIEVTGMSPYAGIPAVVTASSNGATSVSAGAPGPLSQAFMVTVAASDNAAFSSGPGGTWTSLTGVNVSAGAPIILHTAPAYQVASSAQAATWATATASDLSACTAVILVSSPAPVQPNPNWPYTQLQAAFGSGALTPRSQMTWTDITPRFLAGQEASVQRGKNRQLDQVQSSAITLTLANSDSALDPGNTSSPFYPNVVADTPMRLLMTWQGRTYSQFSGFVEKWPQSWKASTRQGLATVTITDAWSLMIDQLSSCQQSEILLGQPYAYWTCGDVVGSAYAQNFAPGNSSVLQQVLSKSGALTAVAAFGADSGRNDGDPSGTMWQQSGLTSGSQGYGYCLTCADQNYPPLSGGVTIMGWFDPTGGATQLSNGSILIRAVNSALGTIAQVSLNSPSGGNPGGIAMTVWDKVTRVPTVTQVNTADWLVAPLGGDLHITLLLTQTTWRVIVNGGNFTGASGTCNLPPVMSWLSFMGAADRFGTGYMFNGACGHLAVFPVLLTDDRVSQIVIAGYPNTNGGQFQGEAPHTRIERLAGYGGWSGPRAIGTSGTTQIAAITDIQGSGGRISASGHVQAAQGQQAGQAVTNIVASDNGFMAVDGNGVLCYQSRGDFYGQQPAWLLGENTSGGEIPYLGDVTFGEDKALLYNVAQLTQSTGTGVAVVATNGPSALQHGDSPYTATAYLNDINVVGDEANWIVNTQGTPVNRFESVTVDAAANSANWPFVLGIEPATPVQVTRRPVTASSPTVVQGISAQVTRKFDAQAGVARVTLTGDTFPEGQVLTADSPTLGQLNGINRLAW